MAHLLFTIRVGLTLWLAYATLKAATFLHILTGRYGYDSKVAFVIGVQNLFPPILVINIATWLVFWFDKQQSRQQNWRTPERELLWWLWTTGVFGGWFSMFACRHKIRKESFIIKALFFTVFNLTWLIFYAIFDIPKQVPAQYIPSGCIQPSASMS